jgi:hypothetical protein
MNWATKLALLWVGPVLGLRGRQVVVSRTKQRRMRCMKKKKGHLEIGVKVLGAWGCYDTCDLYLAADYHPLDLDAYEHSG